MPGPAEVEIAAAVMVVLQQVPHTGWEEGSHSKPQAGEGKDRGEIRQQVVNVEELGEPFGSDSRGLQRERFPDQECYTLIGLP